MTDAETSRGRDFIKRFFGDLRPHVAFPTHLLGQASAAFDGGSWMGTSILCRAALEAAYCWFLQWTTGAKGEIQLVRGPDGPRLLPGQRQPGGRFGFEAVVAGIRDRGILSEGQLQASERIRRNGNWVAHMVTVTDRDRMRSLNPLEWTPTIGQDQAWADLEDTGDIIKSLEDALPSIYR